jgi:hypothetical protein
MCFLAGFQRERFRNVIRRYQEILSWRSGAKLGNGNTYQKRGAGKGGSGEMNLGNFYLTNRFQSMGQQDYWILWNHGWFMQQYWQIFI